MKGLREEMTLRDHFAGLAMSGLATMEGYIGPEYIAMGAYELADAMLKERDKTYKERHATFGEEA